MSVAARIQRLEEKASGLLAEHRRPLVYAEMDALRRRMVRPEIQKEGSGIAIIESEAAADEYEAAERALCRDLDARGLGRVPLGMRMLKVINAQGLVKFRLCVDATVASLARAPLTSPKSSPAGWGESPARGATTTNEGQAP